MGKEISWVISALGSPDLTYPEDNIHCWYCSYGNMQDSYLAVRLDDRTVVSNWIYSRYLKRLFHSQAWKSDPENRYEMSEDLIDRILPGLSHISQVQTLLGTPEQAHSSQWSYYLGIRSVAQNSMAPEYLQITISNQAPILYRIIRK